MVYNFTPISIQKFAAMVAKNNKDEKRENVIKAIKSVLNDVKKGEKCSCGNPIWVAGSALADYSCFTCITGETDASEDYEIDEALELKTNVTIRN